MEETANKDQSLLKDIAPDKNEIKKWVWVLLAAIILLFVAGLGFAYVRVETTNRGRVETQPLSD